MEITKTKMCCNVCVKTPQQWQAKLHHYQTQTFSDGIHFTNFTLFTRQKKHILCGSRGIGIFDLQDTTFMKNCSFIVIVFIVQFSIIHKHEQFYLVIDVHFLLLNSTKVLTMLDQTTYLTFFILQRIWLQIVYDNLHFENFPTNLLLNKAKGNFEGLLLYLGERITLLNRAWSNF
jgi:hypothetical protein